MKGLLKTLAAAWIALTAVSLDLNAMNVQIREGQRFFRCCCHKSSFYVGLLKLQARL
jgi:hypothetical protein